MSPSPLEIFLKSFEGIQDPEVVMALFSDDCEFRAPGGVSVKGSDKAREYLSAIHLAMPEVMHEVTNTLVSGDGSAAAIELTSTAVHKGTFEMEGFGQVAPTERTISVNGVVMLRFDGDRISSLHMYFDRMGLADQLNAPAAAVLSGGD